MKLNSNKNKVLPNDVQKNKNHNFISPFFFAELRPFEIIIMKLVSALQLKNRPR